MSSTPVPETDYRRTARRRMWSRLPAAVQEYLAAQLGGQVDSVVLAGGGFTPGFAGILASADGKRIFAKAAPASDAFVYPAYRRESEVVPLLPDGMPVPRLLAAGDVTADSSGGAGGDVPPGSGDSTDWHVLVYEAVDGRMPGTPWTEDDLAAVESSCATSARLLSAGFPPGMAGTSVAEDILSTPSPFLEVADGGPAPWFLPGMTAARARRFQQCLEDSPRALAGTSVLHGDLRPDNILIRSGRALFCDWNFLGTGAAWIDWVGVLPYARGGGIDVEAWLRRSTLTCDVPPEHIDAFLAALLAYMVNSGNAPEVGASPQLRSHGRHTARLIFEWVLSRWDQPQP